MIKDSDLAYLLSLGFELELCKQALTENTTLEDATEWILNPTLPPVKKSSTQPMDNVDLTQPVASSSVLGPSTIKPIDPNKEKVEKEIQQKKFQRVQQGLKKEKLLEREARKKALLDIKEDKQKRQQKKVISTPITQPSTAANNTTTTTTTTTIEDKGAFIQFKFTNSSILRQKFPTITTVRHLLDFVSSKELELNPTNQQLSIESISLVNVFPKRTFTLQDGSLNMKDAGFLPNVSLNVSIIIPEIVEEQPENVDVEMAEEQQDDTTNNNNMDLDQMPAIDPHRPPIQNIRSIWGRFGTGHQLTDAAPVTESIAVDETNENTNDTTNRRSNILLALEQRSQQSNQPSVNEQINVGLERHVTPLHEICSKSVAVLLTQHTVKANQYLKNIGHISSDVAESLVKHLVKTGKLNASTLRKLTDYCYLQNIILDSYIYCTDSLIEDLAKSNSCISITKLSLRGCDVITDNGIRSLTGLKNLSYLDVNNCKLTDKGLKSLQNLQYLNYLNLSKTKITDQGIASMITNAKFKSQLEVLLLDGCSRIKSSQILVPIMNEFEQLVQLSLANTYIQKQEINKLKKDIKLEQLDLSNTFITDDDLMQIISQFHHLVELKLGGCKELTTRGLSFLPRNLNQLCFIQFPNREHELDGVLARFKDLPLEHLDLSGFLNITDEGAGYIANMKKLRYVNLDGTKITDEGVTALKDLIDLEKLYLDRTAVTDEGLSQLKGLSNLETLSLSHTQVSNSLLRLIGDFEKTSFTRYLRTLNLSQCSLVTDKGVKRLTGMINLTNLNLDHTGVSKSCLKYLKDLKYLKLVRLQGIEKEQDDEMDTDDEENN